MCLSTREMDCGRAGTNPLTAATPFLVRYTSAMSLDLDRSQSSRPRGDPRPAADEIADMADSGRSVSEYFTNNGTLKQPIPSLRKALDQLGPAEGQGR